MPWWSWLLIAFAVVVAVWAAFVLWLVAVGRREDARAFATFIPDGLEPSTPSLPCAASGNWPQPAATVFA